MYSTLHHRLQKIKDSGKASTLSESKIGIEKECLRVAENGGISSMPHPTALGAALTHPFITTDFSEALLELITPPTSSVNDALMFLDELHQFVYSKLENEILWATSMPCVMEGGDHVPVAYYGTSNAGKMKTVYRRGLGHRYGRAMQVIAGVHFNFSFSENFWSLYKNIEADHLADQAFISERYMGLIRNVLRYGWLIPYLFGASPGVCKSFLHGKKTVFSEFNENTYYEPYATSLRMGDIGYTNNKEDMAGIKANYNSIDSYVESLIRAINTPFEAYTKIGVNVDGEYRQLNDSILQIENEYYSTVRPKQIPGDNEKPVTALKKRGIAYIEIRSLDVNAFHPLGINEQQLYFLEVFILFCLLMDSPALMANDMYEIDMNLVQVAHSGRQPGLMLSRQEQAVALKDWALELCKSMEAVADLYDQVSETNNYTDSLKEQVKCIKDPEETPSARMLREMREHGEGFFHFAKRMSLQHFDYFVSRKLPENRTQYFNELAKASIQKQRDKELSDKVSFEEFLRSYYAESN